MVGILVSFWDGIFSGDIIWYYMLVSGRVDIIYCLTSWYLQPLHRCGKFLWFPWRRLACRFGLHAPDESHAGHLQWCHWIANSQRTSPCNRRGGNLQVSHIRMIWIMHGNHWYVCWYVFVIVCGCFMFQKDYSTLWPQIQIICSLTGGNDRGVPLE